MYITIRIDYKTSQRINVSGGFTLRGGKPEAIVFEWWKKIKSESFNPVLERVVINEDQDITDLVKALDNAPIPEDNLPF